MEQLVNWQTLGAFGVTLVVLVLLVRWIVVQLMKSLEKREEAVMSREKEILNLMTSVTETITLANANLTAIAAGQEKIIQGVRRSETNIKRAIKANNGKA